ncbi:MAG TPA: DNA methyltransferase [Azospirillum sp.]
MNPEAFIHYWHDKGGSERANYQKFINQLCAVLGVTEPEATSEDERLNDYVYERRVRALDVEGEDGRNNYIDCYKRHCFVLEAKQSKKRQRGEEPVTADLFGGLPSAQRAPAASWDRLMKQARAQAERYAKALPAEHGWPPFLVIVDVGHVIETYADFTGLGKAYLPFPDSRSHRIQLKDLADGAIQARLKAIWESPKSLDPAIHRTEVTRDIAQRLARVARGLEKRYPAKSVAMFLMRCLFTAFAEDVGLLPEDSFLNVLRLAEPHPQHLPRYLTPLWRSMDKGNEFDPMIHAKVRHFNGGLFKDAEALAVDADEIGELITACIRDWRNVEPAIFGTLLESALGKRERGQLGAHFTPRAYVERLVVPTVIEPLLEDWHTAQALAEAARGKGDMAGAVAQVRAFHRQLCTTRVLDPACGTGNFLYVALELMKRLEGEVLLALEDLGAGTQASLDLAGLSVGPHQFLGLEKNPRAVPIAELVIWLGHLQWHLRQRGPESLSEPILRPYDTIHEGDAVLAWSREELLRDEQGRVRTKWDGYSYKTDTFTGREVPDDTQTVELKRYHDPKPAEWPEAEFIVGNPPFIGAKYLRQELGDGYAEALWEAYPNMPKGADFVMYWWDKAADLVRHSKVRRFGFITTNSIAQTFAGRVIRRHLNAKPAMHIVLAVPDHPWADARDAAAVRIAMTVGAFGSGEGTRKTIIREEAIADRDGAVTVEFSVSKGRIDEKLDINAVATSVVALRSNEGLSSPGVKLHGDGFILMPFEAQGFLRQESKDSAVFVKKYMNGRDVLGVSRNAFVIDLYGIGEGDARSKCPDLYQIVYDRVRPERMANNRPSYRECWWTFGEPRSEMRRSLRGLSRFIVTPVTAKHRVFAFLNADTVPDDALIVISCEDGFCLGVLCSRIHCLWAKDRGAFLEDRPRYIKTRCFDPFPFPDATSARKSVIGALADELDAHRKRVLAERSGLTVTMLYNVLEKRKAGQAMTPAEQDIYQFGQVGVMLDLHERIDRAVAEAYGWPADLTDAEILERLVALNAERHQEELRGHVRWLRPEFQNPDGRVAPAQLVADLGVVEGAAKLPPWPKAPAEQVQALLAALRATGKAATAETVARRFKGARTPKVRELLDVLVSVGQIRQVGDNHFAA